MAKKIGYARVSTADQSPDLQVEALRAAGCDKIFTDNGVSGTLRSRPAFDTALDTLEKGDILVIWKLDRMGRSLKHLIEINETLQSKGIYFESLTEKIDTSTPMGEFVFHILGAVAQLEREIIRERTLAGLASAAKKGKFPGRPRILSAAQVRYAYKAMQEGAGYEELANELNTCAETIRRRVGKLSEAA